MLGILGGMGPAATVDFMRKIIELTPARRDQDHIEVIACSASRIPERTPAILGNGPDPLPAMVEALHRLERAGADFIAIPCNTAHYWYESLQRQTRLPILHIVDAALSEARARSEGAMRCPGLLATEGTVAAGIYQSRLAALGLECLFPDAAGQARVERGIAHVKRGEMSMAADLLRAEALGLLTAGADAVIMGCTEIPIALADEAGTGEAGPLSGRLVDPALALARACIARARASATEN